MKSIPGLWMMVLLAALCGGCGRTPRAQDSGSRTDSAVTAPSPKYPGSIQPKDCRLPKAPDDLRACVRDLAFDEVEVAGDQQRLMVCRNGACGYGPLATIQPEKSSYEGDLNTGRIIARMYLNRGETQTYPKLALAPRDTTYWWVQKAAGSNTGKSIYMRISGATLITKEGTLLFEPYRGSSPRQGLARWLWIEKDEKTQGGCPSGTCR